MICGCLNYRSIFCFRLKIFSLAYFYFTFFLAFLFLYPFIIIVCALELFLQGAFTPVLFNLLLLSSTLFAQKVRFGQRGVNAQLNSDADQKKRTVMLLKTSARLDWIQLWCGSIAYVDPKRGDGQLKSLMRSISQGILGKYNQNNHTTSTQPRSVLMLSLFLQLICMGLLPKTTEQS